jgi:hypothetical protein
MCTLHCAVHGRVARSEPSWFNSGVIDRHRLHDPDPNPIFHVVADPDTDPDLNPTPIFIHVGKSEIFVFFIAVPV